MRWRGLAPPGCASAPMTRRPECYPAAHRIPAPPEFAGLPATPAFPWDFARGTGPPSVVREFLLPYRRAHKVFG